MTRIIEDWSEAAIKEIKYADDIGETAWTLIPRINSHSGEYKNIGRMILNCEDENTIVQDISDYFCRDAKFPEQKYYVKLIKDDKYSCLNITPVGGLVLGSPLEDNGWKNKFTREEIISMNPQLLLFIEEVED